MRAILCVLVLLTAGCVSYYKCDSCGAAYKSYGGLPGQFANSPCRNCLSGKVIKTTEALSGWDEERYQRNGDELK